METERSPLARKDVPRYTFLGSENQSPASKARRCQCCLCGALIALLLVALAVIISFYLPLDHSDASVSNDSQSLDGLLQLRWPLEEETYKEESLPDLTQQKRAIEAGVESLKEKESLERLLDAVPLDSPTFRHQLATHTSKKAQEMSKLGYILNSGAKEVWKWLANTTNLEDECQRPRRWSFRRENPKSVLEDICGENATLECRRSPYRTANGSCNNLIKDKNWGAALRPFRRILLPRYNDGISEPRKASDGSPLPSARKVSLTIHRPNYRNDVNFTVMLAVWGQFIDHDITATALSKGKDGEAISCCPDYNKKRDQHPECFAVLLEKSDPFYEEYNVTCMEFVRSSPAPTCAFGPREQLNQATNFLDGSVVYGNDEETTNRLRTFRGGELKMLKTSFGELLPVSNDLNDGCNREEEFKRGRYCFLSGRKISNYSKNKKRQQRGILTPKMVSSDVGVTAKQ